jgi:hypothetical protein
VEGLLCQEDFTPHIGKAFHFAGHRPALTLVRIDARPRDTMPGSERTPFTVLFHGPLGDILPEGLYRAEIESGRALEFYISPIHTVARDRQDYQAVFN